MVAVSLKQTFTSKIILTLFQVHEPVSIRKLEGLFEGLISMDEHKILFGAKAFYEPPLVKPKKGSHQVEQRVQSASSVSVADIERVMGINKEEGETATPKAYDVSQVFKVMVMLYLLLS